MRKRKGKAAVAVAVAEAPPAVIEEPEVDTSLVPITTILLAFVNADVVSAGDKKKAYAMVLWADGPDITPVAHFANTRYIMKEYNAASDRGAMKCGCSFGQNIVKATMAVHASHVVWHNKYRLYFQLRQDKFPTLKDMDATRTWTSS